MPPVRLTRSSLRAFAGRYGIAFGIATVVAVLAVVGVNVVIDQKIDDITRVKVDTAPAPPQGANYLLIGSDSRRFVDSEADREAFGDEEGTQGQRSDTMMVLHVEPAAQRTYALSFPRDLWVDIPGVGGSRINAAFNDGGPDLVIDTLRANFGIEINHYLQVDFKTFKGVVDAIGRVPVYFPYQSRDLDTGLNHEFAGCKLLDGTGALEYVRSRSLEYWSVDKQRWFPADLIPDINRIARQQDFMRKLAGLAIERSLNNPFTANEVADEVLDDLKADESLSKDDVFELIEAFRTANAQDVRNLDFQTLDFVDGPDQNGQDVLYPGPNAPAQVAALMDFSGDTSTAPPVPAGDVRLRVLNGTGRNGEARSASKAFDRLGFVTEDPRNDPRRSVDQTEVRYAPGAKDKGRAVLRFIQPAARLVEDADVRGVDVVVVLGRNFSKILVPPLATSTTAAPDPNAAPTTLPPTTTTTRAADRDASTTTTTLTPAPILNQDQIGFPAPRNPPC